VAAACEGLSYWTDAAILAGAGIPAVLFGPAGAGLHSSCEWVEIESVAACARALESLAALVCARPARAG
jgi:acetylornithine deacetylase